VTSAHLDTFARQALPPPSAQPEFRFDLPELQYPEQLNAVDALLDRHVREGRGGRRAIVAPGIEWSYADLLDRANRIANVLTNDLGVVPGNRVLLRAPNTPTLAACWLAVVKAGAIAVTTMPLYRASELRHMIEKAAIRHALCDARIADELATAVVGSSVSVTLFGEPDAELERRMAYASPVFANVATAADDVALIGFTSGTTGVAKATMHYHRDLLAICDTYGKHVLCARPDDLFTGSPPLGFTFGLGGELIFPLHIGAAALMLEKASPADLLRAIGEYGVNVIFTAPIAYRAMTSMLGDADVSSLRLCVSAGETLPAPVWEAWREATGLKILDGIGSTEMLHIFVGSSERDARAGATGRVVPGYVAEIHDDDGNPLPLGAIGKIAVKGPTGCRYLADDRQGTYVRGGWNYPGDAYSLDAEGFFHYVARTDDMIVSAGYNISGPEVEQALLAHDGVRECAVVAKADPAHGTNIVKAFVVVRDGAVDADALIAFCKAKIAPYKAPREVEFVDALPRTETGKVQRYKLRARATE
jgi:2-aminobenzoate-CoA ligase